MYSKTEAAYIILKEKKRPLHVKEIIEIALAKRMISTKGKTPDSTLASEFFLENKRKAARHEKPRFVKKGSGVWGLADWK